MTRRVSAAARASDGVKVHPSAAAARRLTLVKQRMGQRPTRPPSGESLLSVVRDLAYVQWDPVPIVAPSHLLSFRARVGNFRTAELDSLLWKERKLLQHWIPFAAIVSTADFPLYASLMRRYPDSLSASWGRQREYARKFLAGHAALRRKILRELRDGPLTVSQFEDHHRTRRDEGDWGSASDVSLMLFCLLMKGEVMIVGHSGAQNVWGRLEDFLPSSVPRTPLSHKAADETAAERAVLALGTATRREVALHFIRGCYDDLPATLGRLESRGRILRVAIDDAPGRKEERYVHASDVARLSELEAEFAEPQVSLVPPFDNLVYSQERLQRLFGFDYVREQFLPKEKRRFGTYVLPIVWGDRFIGRIDPRFNKKTGTLEVQSVHAERDAPNDVEVTRAISVEIAGLAEFVGAERVAYTSRVPKSWRRALH